MSQAIKDIKPKILWQLFAQIAEIPRCSKYEEAVRNYIEEKANEFGFESKKDETGNIVVKVPATPGFESAPTVILQGHMDMVCTKNSDVDFDFMKDPIRMVRNGDWIKADGTTLGADNGIGIAAGLAVAISKEVQHGPLEILATVDEETGLTGAMELAPDMLEGKILLNLDSEDIGVICMGCAGGSGVDSFMPLVWKIPDANYTGAMLEIKGLRGGHSGIDIHENRGNAIKLIARALWSFSKEIKIELTDIAAGDKHNAIPREGFALFAIPADSFDSLAKVAKKLADDFIAEFPRDTNLSVTLTKTEKPEKSLAPETTLRAVSMLLAYPSGILSMSQDMEDLVETSNNLAIVKIEKDQLYTHNSPRSSMGEAIRGVLDQIHAVSNLAGAKTEEEEAYPGWQPNPESKILKLLEDVHLELFGVMPKRLAYHAGLECGIIGEKFPGMDMVSFGPEIINPHSPDEAIKISTVVTFWTHLAGALKAIAQGRY